MVAGKIRVLSAALTLGNKKISKLVADLAGIRLENRARVGQMSRLYSPPISEADVFEDSVSYDVTSLQSERCAAQLVQFLFLIRSQSAEILFLRLIVDLVGGADIGS